MCKGTGMSQGGSTHLARIRFQVQVSAPGFVYTINKVYTKCVIILQYKRKVIAGSFQSEGRSITAEHSAVTSQTAPQLIRDLPKEVRDVCRQPASSPCRRITIHLALKLRKFPPSILSITHPGSLITFPCRKSFPSS